MILGTEFIIEDFDSVWPSLEARCGRRMLPSAVTYARAECAEGRAVCLASVDGIVVVALEPADGGKMRANVLLAASTGLFGAFQRQESAMLAIARDIGAAELAFWTPRKGWGKLVGPQWHQDVRQDGVWFARSIE